MKTTGGVKRSNVRLLGPLAALVIALAVPVLIRDNQHTLLLATTVVLYAALATAWNIIGGMGGQLDFAAGAYLGLGAFVSGTMLIRWDITPWIGMLLGGLLAAGFAAIIGYPLFLFRVREVWYSLSSAALVEVLRAVFLLWDEVGGPIERYLPFYTDSIARSIYTLRFRSYIPYYYIVLGILILALVANHRIKNSKLGYYLLALGENEDAAEVLGVDARACKLRALMIYAFLCGIMGTAYAALYGHISPMFFSTPLSTEVAILGIVGGMGITYGPLVAAVIMVSLREVLRANLSTQMEAMYLAIYAVALILVVLFRPGGIATIFQDIYARLTSRFAGDRNVA
jgi:branched-chain amino acid transport system permease protein